MSDIQFDREAHSYMMDGVQLPSVTEIIGDCGAFPKYSNSTTAAGRGTLIHQLIADYFSARLDYSKVGPEGLGIITLLQERLNEYGPIIAVEKIAAKKNTFDGKFGYAGTIDALTEIEVFEWKSGQPANWHFLQVAAYCYLAGKKKGNVVYIDKGCLIVPVDNIEKEFEIFLEMLDIYNWKRRK